MMTSSRDFKYICENILKFVNCKYTNPSILAIFCARQNITKIEIAKIEFINDQHLKVANLQALLSKEILNIKGKVYIAN